MESALKSMYRDLVKDYASKIRNKRSQESVSKSFRLYINTACRIAERGVRRRVDGKARALAFDTAVGVLARGLPDLLETHSIDSSHPDFQWVLENYGRALSLGTRRPLLGFSYSTKQASEDIMNVVTLTISPRKSRQDIYIREYESAVENGWITPVHGCAYRFSDVKRIGGNVKKLDDPTVRALTLELRL